MSTPTAMCAARLATCTEPGVLVELMDAAERPDGFLQRFLDAKGEGPHHLTFEVPDLNRTIAALKDLGIRVIQVSTDHPPWQEAFIHPAEARREF